MNCASFDDLMKEYHYSLHYASYEHCFVVLSSYYRDAVDCYYHPTTYPSQLYSKRE